MLSLVRLSALLAASAAIVNGEWPSQSYKTEDFEVPVFKTKSFKAGKTAPGSLFLGLVHAENPKDAGPIIVDNSGELIWHGPQEFPAYYNFQTQQLGGEDRLTWWNGYLERTGHGYGHVAVYDKSYNFVKQICFPSSVNIVVPRPDEFPGKRQSPCYVDKHESIATDRNSIIVTAYNVTQTDLTKVGGPKNGWVYDCLFFELDLDTNEVLFSWSALDHVPVTKSNYLNPNGNPLQIGKQLVGHSKRYPWDYFHINSVDPIPGGYIANSRMTWSLYKIDGTTGDIDWTLEGSNGGDFKLEDPIFFSWQHHPRVQKILDNGNRFHIHLFNNDNVPNVIQITNVSSGYMLDINEKSNKVHALYNLKTQPNGGIYSTAEGSQQTLAGNHHLMGYGSEPFIEEYNKKNQLIYFAQFGKYNASTHAYRTYRSEWSATPSAKPKAVASLANRQLTVYMSWNGATEVDSWSVQAGKSQNEMHSVATGIKKSGFETMVQTKIGKHKLNYFSVTAYDGQGNTLAESDPIEISKS